MLKQKDFVEMRRVSSTAFNNTQKLLDIVNRQMGKKKSIKSKPINQANTSNEEDQSALASDSTAKSQSITQSSNLYQIPQFNSNRKTLEYQLKVYKQKTKYAPNKSFEKIKEIPKSCFIRTNNQNGNNFSSNSSPNMIKTPKKHYLGNKLVLFRHKYCTDYNGITRSQIKSKRYSSSSIKVKEIVKKCISPTGTPLTSQKLFSYTTSLINKITNQANEELDNFKKDVMQNALSSTSLSAKTNLRNLFLSKNQLCLDQIRKEYHLDDLKSNKIDQLQLIKQNYDKVKISLDDKCRSVLKQVINQVVYEDSQLNKSTICDYSSYHLNQLIKNREQFAKVGNEMLMLKKEIRGKSAIEPSDDRKTFNKLIKEIVEDDVEDLIIRKNVLRFNQNFSPRKIRRSSSLKKI